MRIMRGRRRGRNSKLVLAGSVALLGVGMVLAQPPHMRTHTANQKRPLELVRADQSPPGKSRVQFDVRGHERLLQVNGIPNHSVGRFPNRGNPHRITEQRTTLSVPTQPRRLENPREIRLGENFGIGVNGIFFDPAAAEFWMGNPRAGWQYDALGGAVALGLDAHYAHVQPNGKYHYHGLPHGLLQSLGVEAGKHSPLVGWAADGFPIYAVYGFSDPTDGQSEVKPMEPSYRLRSGRRPSGSRGPGGTYDGTFVQDYEHFPGTGDLDECNGRNCVTPEFPNGTYAYFLTHHWPVVPRLFRGEPDASFGGKPGPPPGVGSGRRSVPRRRPGPPR